MGEEMAAATKPPMIAPGIICPKCKGPMLDERGAKRTDKSPDYTCANMLCTDASGKYRTAIWEKANGSAGGEGSAGNSAGAPSADPPANRDEAIRVAKAKHAIALKQADQYVLDHILPLFEAKKIGLTGDEVYKHAYTIFQTWEDKGLIE